MCLGTCWKALVTKAFLDFCMLFSNAPISNSRALMKEATLSSPLAEAVALACWTGITRASTSFCRLRVFEDCAGRSEPGFRF